MGKGRPYSKEVRRLGFFIATVAIFTHNGPLRVTGEAPPPSIQDMCDVTRSLAAENPAELVQVSRLSQEPLDQLIAKESVESVLELCGGWDIVVKAACLFRNMFPTKWRLFMEFCLVGGIEGPKLRGAAPYIARKFGITTLTAKKWRDETPLIIAGLALHGSAEVFDEISFTS